VTARVTAGFRFAALPVVAPLIQMRLFRDKRNVLEYLIRISVYICGSGGDGEEQFSQLCANGRSSKAETPKTDNKMMIASS
jgi:hypothetical protein